MPEQFLLLSVDERAEILQTLANKSSRYRAEILEKDIWVCWSLKALFEMKSEYPMVFKGGTSLSKAFRAIERFSEDIDITLDLSKHLEGTEPFSGSTSRTKKKDLSEMLDKQCDSYVRSSVVEHLKVQAENFLSSDQLQIKPDKANEITLSYESRLDYTKYIPQQIKLEFGGRNSIVPNSRLTLRSYASEIDSKLEYPVADVQVLAGKRTFWEKATLIHDACNRGRLGDKLERKTRHWYDLAKLADHEIGEAALSDLELLADVAKYKDTFYYHSRSNYNGCLSGNFNLVPEGAMLRELENDFEKMKNEGMFENTGESFQQVIERLTQLEKEIKLRVG